MLIRVELYLQSPIRLHGVFLSQTERTTLPCAHIRGKQFRMKWNQIIFFSLEMPIQSLWPTNIGFLGTTAAIYLYPITSFVNNKYLFLLLWFYALLPVLVELWPPHIFYVRFRDSKFLQGGGGCPPHAQPPTWRSRISLLVWHLPRNLSSTSGPTSSYAGRQTSVCRL
jgi:hypothetical protein